MAEKQVTREITVKVCDFCGEETDHLDTCAVCKREMCAKDGGAAHSDYSLEVYRYHDGTHLTHGAKICNECSGRKFDGTIQELFDGMMAKPPVPTAKE